MSEIVSRLNKTLQSRYGSNIRMEPIFRVVWSDDQREKRFGVFNEFYGKIFIREIRGLQEVPKYPTNKHVWILERWMSPEIAFTPEIPATSEGSYEPLFVFVKDNGEALPIIPEQVYRIIYTALNPQLPGHMASEMREQEREEFANEVAENVEILAEEGRTWIGHRLHSKEAIIKP